MTAAALSSDALDPRQKNTWSCKSVSLRRVTTRCAGAWPSSAASSNTGRLR